MGAEGLEEFAGLGGPELDGLVPACGGEDFGVGGEGDGGDDGGVGEKSVKECAGFGVPEFDLFFAICGGDDFGIGTECDGRDVVGVIVGAGKERFRGADGPELECVVA